MAEKNKRVSKSQPSLPNVPPPQMGEMIRLIAEVDGVIDVHGGWPVK